MCLTIQEDHPPPAEKSVCCFVPSAGGLVLAVALAGGGMTSSDARDPAIKLFGRTIQLPACAGVEDGRAPSDMAVPDHGLLGGEVGVAAGCPELVKDPENEGDPKREQEDAPSTADTLPSMASAGSEAEAAATTTESENPKTPSPETSLEKEAAPLKPSEEEQSEANNNNSKEKPALKKPDKILPCPRCNSLDTKFCYYNNYNVNQPRHFCKNCQRYWTAGGTMRNVPVGAGRRKNKNSGSHYRQLTLSDAAARSDHAEAMAHRMPLKPNGTTVLSFSTDASICESMSSELNLAERSMMKSCYGNGFLVQEEQSRGEQQSVNSCVSASTNASEVGNNRVNLRDQTAAASCYPGFAQIPCFPQAPWAYPWSPAQWRAPMPPSAAPAFCNSSFPVPAFFPAAAAAYWGCAAAAPGAWAGHVPWISPPSPTAVSCVSGSNSPTLGKHSRDENAIKQCDGNDKEREQSEKGGSERCLWIPKTLRIDDPGEAAMSSIWATLGISKDKCDGISGGGLFKAFPADVEERNHTAGASQVLHANPAALSRSLTFHESS